ncbi:sensor domain-containing phosphodiesterase [Motilibacter aurantiacus]|uniref:sensor domain-containing phosphodiesterase n=1 Tax=Motilibacter aurantiacus TaxID=2714955 RepID=UPI00140E0561|nr:EAL domain-containing protein [Motilibacter aurantiacus]NHC46083.1 EAL domain-containing protein [Motilibacter aurantiacus]
MVRRGSGPSAAQSLERTVEQAIASPSRLSAVLGARSDLYPLGPALDALARTVARLSGAETGLVTLLTPGLQHRVGRSGTGIPVDERRPDVEVPCAHVVAFEEPLVVPDCASDVSFRASAEGPHAFRFYAGAPVLASEGQCVGTVSVRSRLPHEPSHLVSPAALVDAARQASALLAVARGQAERAAQLRVLAALAAGRPMRSVLELLAAEVESLLGPGLRCSVLVLDPATRTLSDAAGPSLTEEFRMAVDGLAVAEGQGPCGSAAYRREPVVAVDLTDPVWAPFLRLTRELGIQACASLPVLAPDGEPLGTLALYRDEPGAPSAYEWATLRSFAGLTRLVIERSRVQAELTRLATRDEVTGLLNRSTFLRRAEELLAAPPAAGTDHVLLFCDVDQFKLVNDTLGHAAGDAYLRRAASALRERLRPEDLIARFAGDAFTVFAADVPRAGVDALAERAGGAFTVPLQVGGHDLRLSASVGAACSSVSGSAVDDLLRDADLAMHEAKLAGRAQTRVCDASLRARAASRSDLVLALRHAILEGETSVAYQPEVDLLTGELLGLEALCRWARPGGGPVAPDVFVPLAEEAGLIGGLGRQVLATAMADLARWRERAAAVDGLTVWVNVSPLQLNDARFVPGVADLLDRHALPGHCLGLEVTETAVTAPRARARLHELRGLGVRIAVDDFGTGYSSLGALKALPVDLLKIDRAFIDGLHGAGSDARIVAAILAMADALGLTVLAEGVERAEQLSALVRLGCTRGQGFLLGAPEPATAIEARLSAPGPGAAAGTRGRPGGGRR